MSIDRPCTDRLDSRALNQSLWYKDSLLDGKIWILVWCKPSIAKPESFRKKYTRLCGIQCIPSIAGYDQMKVSNCNQLSLTSSFHFIYWSPSVTASYCEAWSGKLLFPQISQFSRSSLCLRSTFTVAKSLHFGYCTLTNCRLVLGAGLATGLFYLALPNSKENKSCERQRSNIDCSKLLEWHSFQTSSLVMAIWWTPWFMSGYNVAATAGRRGYRYYRWLMADSQAYQITIGSRLINLRIDHPG